MVYIKRDLEPIISKSIKIPEIIALVGARQVGKTTLINNLLLNYKNKRTLKLSFDNIEDLNLFVNDIDSFIDLYIKNYDFIFIDELHYAKDSGKLLKYIYDLGYDCKIIVSGSSAVDLSIQSLKYLVGRVVSFELYSFSFREFLKFKNKSIFELFENNNYKEEILFKLNNLFEEYLIFGGYPRIILEKDLDIKKNLLTNIYNIYALREIKELNDLKDDFRLHKLIKALALQIGSLIDYNELKTITGYNHNQLKSVLNILEKTYVCNFVSPFFTNKRKELVKSKKVYFCDIGIRNAVINDFKDIKNNEELGHIYENLVLNELVKNNYEVKYWRTQTGAEVDFVLELNNNVIPIEIKSHLKSTTVTKSFLSFIDKYAPKKAYVLSKNFEGNRIINNTKIEFLPFVKFISKIKNLFE